jgi:hypothetical protein
LLAKDQESQADKIGLSEKHKQEISVDKANV